MNSIPTYIIAGLTGMLALIVVAVSFPILLGVTDTYYLEYVNRCVYKGDNFIRAYGPLADGTTQIPASGTGSTAISVVQKSGGTTCTFNKPADTVGQIYLNEHEQHVFTSASAAAAATQEIASSKWMTPLAILLKYDNISKLILQVSPIIGSVGFLGLSVSGLLSYSQGTSQIMTVILRSLGGLIVSIALIFLGPQIMGFLDAIYILASSGRLSVLERFDDLVELVMGFAPVLYNASLLVLYSVLGAWQSRESRGMGGRNSFEGAPDRLLAT